MAIELIALLLTVIGIGWYVHQRKQTMREELDTIRTTLTLANEHGQTTFSGANAQVLWEETIHGGDASTGPWQTGFYLCRMPGASEHHWLQIESTRKGQPARYKLEPLDAQELACFRALHPDVSL